MKKILVIVSFIGLILTILPSFLVFMSIIEFEQHLWLMGIGTIAWFSTAPFWLNKKEEIE